MSSAKPFAKYSFGSSLGDKSTNFLEMSLEANIKFKDIDVSKALEVLNSEFYITPPSTILVLRDIVTIEEVK